MLGPDVPVVVVIVHVDRDEPLVEFAMAQKFRLKFNRKLVIDSLRQYLRL